MSKHLPKCRACGNEPKEPAEIEYSLGVVPYETTRITVVRCWRIRRDCSNRQHVGGVERHILKRSAGNVAGLHPAVLYQIRRDCDVGIRSAG